MIHLGDITKIFGHEVPVVDCIIGGSPCQDLSIAGKRAGLAGERSGLFMEQIRIVKQMRKGDKQCGKTGKAVRPRFMVWENVPGAFSSNRGEDFRAVLEETIRIAAPDAPSVPLPPQGRWPLADAYIGDGWSVAYRVFDAQFWGVPQRRRRIALVADFGGRAAPKILFERKSLSGDIEAVETAGQTAPAGIGGGVDNTIRGLRENAVDHPAIGSPGKIFCLATQQGGAELRTDDKAPTITAAAGMSGNNQPVICLQEAKVYENHQQDSRIKGPLETAPTVSAKYGMGGNNTPLVMATGQASAEISRDLCPTLNCNHEQPIIAAFQNTGRGWWNQSNIGATLRTPCGGDSTKANLVSCGQTVRRLTPLECERLQGYPDGWTDIGAWIDSGGKLHTECTDSARYTALGNSIALPPWRWVLRRLCRFYRRKPTMASLFDGIGGFPLIWEQLNGPGTCLWASEIEDFPIAVTKRHFREGRS